MLRPADLYTPNLPAGCVIPAQAGIYEDRATLCMVKTAKTNKIPACAGMTIAYA